MTVVRTLVLGLLVALVLGPVARGDALRRFGRRESLRWGSYRPNAEAIPVVPIRVLTPPENAPAAPPPPVAPPTPAPGPQAAAADVMTRWATIPQVNPDPSPTPSTATVHASEAKIAPAPSYAVDAFVNLGEGPYAQEGALTAGGGQRWDESPLVHRLFGGRPDGQQRAEFSASILDKVDRTFRQSGVPITLTTDPTVSAAHTLSVVSNTSFPSNPDSVGIADMGNNGFTFIDKFGFARSVDELEWAVARNVAHELMHTFGVDHHDKGGNFLDAPMSPWSVLIDPAAVFSPEAVQDLLARDFRTNNNATMVHAAQMIGEVGTTVVPEPAALAVWGLSGLAALAVVGRRARRSA